MENLINWIALTEAGDLTARIVMVAIGAGVWANLILLATYVPRQAVPVWVAVLIVLGVGLGAGAVHSGLLGHLIHGAVFVCGATGVVLLLLLGIVGTPRSVSENFCQPIDRGRWWTAPGHGLRDRISNWGDLGPRDEPKRKDRGGS